MGMSYYRFLGPGGNSLARAGDSTSFYHKCGTGYGGYMVGDRPTVDEGEVARELFFDNHGIPDIPTYITVTNCDGYYVYFLVDVPTCAYGYCTVEE